MGRYMKEKPAFMPKLDKKCHSFRCRAKVTKKQSTTDTKTITASLTRIQISEQPKVTSSLNVIAEIVSTLKRIMKQG
jgi:hypothetical protein